MNERKATKRALLTSITALVMCVVMLAGTTFAWFTDTAKTNVNKIQAGKLDVQLMMKDNSGKWVNAEGETLNFLQMQESGTAVQSANILWEPGAEYKLPELKVVNNGNLALKYEIAITGAVDADGRTDLDSMKLLDVLKFKSVVGSDTKENVYGQPIATGTLETNGAGQIIQLSAKMDENAGNKYQEMAISGIAITVKAMQASYEYDSNGNTYDRDANGNPDNPTWSVSAHVTANVATAGDTVLKNADGTVELTAPEGSINNATSLKLKVEPKTAVDSSVNITVGAGQTAQPYEISLADEDGNPVTAATSKVFTVKLYVGKGLNSNNVKVYHNSTEITGVQYDSNSGYVTFTTSSFSPFTVVFDTPVAIVGDTYYNTLADAVAAAENGATITLLKDVAADVVIPAGKTITLDLGGHKLTNVETDVKEQQKHTIVNNGTLTITGTGTVDNVTNGKAALVNYGTATLNGGNFTRSKENPENNKNNGGGNSYYTILNDKGATMTINEGVTVSNVGHFSSMICNCGDANPVAVSKMTINGGTFSGGINTVKNDGCGVLTINGGDFSNTSQVVIMNWHRATISGGTFEANASAEAVLFTAKYLENVAVGDLKIEGGTYVCAKNQKLIIDRFDHNDKYLGTAVISGGTFSSEPDSKYIAEGYTATNDNGVWTVTEKSN